MFIKAYTIGFQDDARGGWVKLYNLLEPLPGHPAGSTVSLDTIERLGYRVHTVPAPVRQYRETR